MERIRKHIKTHHIISALAFGGMVFAAMNFNHPPLFQNTDNFVLFAQEVIELEKEVQVSSGDLGSNKKLDIEKDTVINGNLFADRITIDKNTTINGNASFNKLKTEKDAQILGTKITPISLPIANLPEIPVFQIGTEDFKFTGDTNTLPAGSYRDIVIEKDSRLTLTGGIYNLRKLELKENSIFIFNASTTINIQFKLRGHDNVSILPGLNLKPDDLKINYLGIKSRKEKDEREDDDEEIESLHDNKDKKDHKAGKIGRPVVFGKNSFLNFKLLAPKAKVQIEKESTLRGQILARKVKIGKEGILSREEAFVKESDPAKVVANEEGAKFIVNEITVLLTNEATEDVIQAIAESINGRLTGFLPILKMAKIEIGTATIAAQGQIIDQLKALNSPFILDVLPNFIFE